MREHNRQVKIVYNHSNKEACKRKMEGSTIKSKTLNKDVSMTEDELFYEEFNTDPISSCSKKVKKSKYNTKSVRNVAIHNLR